jgi:hypothetical protein
MFVYIFLLFVSGRFADPKSCSPDRQNRCCKLGSPICNHEDRKMCGCVGGPALLKLVNAKTATPRLSMVPVDLCKKCCSSAAGDDCNKDDRDDCGCLSVSFSFLSIKSKVLWDLVTPVIFRRTLTLVAYST